MFSTQYVFAVRRTILRCVLLYVRDLAVLLFLERPQPCQNIYKRTIFICLSVYLAPSTVSQIGRLTNYNDSSKSPNIVNPVFAVEHQRKKSVHCMGWIYSCMGGRVAPAKPIS